MAKAGSWRVLLHGAATELDRATRSAIARGERGVVHPSLGPAHGVPLHALELAARACSTGQLCSALLSASEAQVAGDLLEASGGATERSGGARGVAGRGGVADEAGAAQALPREMLCLPVAGADGEVAALWQLTSVGGRQHTHRDVLVVRFLGMALQLHLARAHGVNPG